jgi:hypothetical protein
VSTEAILLLALAALIVFVGLWYLDSEDGDK